MTHGETSGPRDIDEPDEHDVVEDEDEDTSEDETADAGTPKRRRRSARKERVLHTRVPAVLEEELKRLAHGLRVPVSNVVRAILEDAVDAVDSAAGRAEDELLGFADRLARQRGDLRKKTATTKDAGPKKPTPAPLDEPSCPAETDVLDGVYGYQPLRLAADTACSVCGRTLRAGTDAHRALFDDPGKRAFVGARCRLLPDGEAT